MSVESDSEYAKAIAARVARYETLKRKLKRPPTPEELGAMPVPSDLDIMLAELDEAKQKETLGRLRKAYKYTHPSPEVAEAAQIARSRSKALGIKAKTGGLIGVVQFTNGNWQARFTPPKGYGCNARTSTHATVRQAVEARNDFIREYYGDSRPWLFADWVTYEASQLHKQLTTGRRAK